MNWRDTLDLSLRELESPRVLSNQALYLLAQKQRPTLSRRGFQSWLSWAIETRRLTLVQRGLYLNKGAEPPVVLAEAAHRIRAGAVVNLQSVLGDLGVLNNPSLIVTAIVPIRRDELRPKLGTVHTTAGEYRFHGIPEQVFSPRQAPRDTYRERGSRYPRATGEKALLDWLYLAQSSRSYVKSPPLDTDLELLNRRTLRSLAKAMGLAEALDAYLARKQEHDESPSVRDQHSVDLGF